LPALRLRRGTLIDVDDALENDRPGPRDAPDDVRFPTPPRNIGEAMIIDFLDTAGALRRRLGISWEEAEKQVRDAIGMPE
jgi:hypothetical protein